MKISYIIPYRNRPGILMHHLNALKLQTYKDFEVIIVDDASNEKFDYKCDLAQHVHLISLDENSGPNKARNVGIENSSGDVVLIVGDDTIPHHNLIATHAYEHLMSDDNCIIQGITPFHPDCLDTVFMQTLNKSGIQANWGALKTESGWKREIDGFCLTTNISMPKSLIESIGGFDESFKMPAWDDIAFGLVAKKFGIKTLFNHKAINLHMHKYTVNSFANRQIMEGMSRIHLCMIHPEMSGQLISPEFIRRAEQVSYKELLYMCDISLKSLEVNQDLFSETMQHASNEGILRDINSRDKIFEILKHLHSPESVFAACNGLRAYQEDNHAYLSHCVGWLIDTAPDNWASYTFAGDASIKLKNRENAIMYYQKSISIADNPWARERIDSLL